MRELVHRCWVLRTAWVLAIRRICLKQSNSNISTLLGRPQYCKERWGGMHQYMAHIGFDRHQQERLAAALTDEDW